MENLIQQVNEDYWNVGSDRESLLKHINNIKEFGKMKFLVAYMKSFTMREINGLLLCLPEIWKDFTVKDWLNVMQAVGDRPSHAPKGQIGDVGVYSDLMLLCKYLEIDGLDLYLNHPQITKQNKLSVLAYMQGFVAEFVKNDFDYEDLSEGETNVFSGFGLADLYKIKNLLLQDSKVKEFPQNETSAQNFIRGVYQNYKSSFLTV